MSILIKGMEMPKDCPYCPLAHWNFKNEFTGCEIVKKYFSTEEMYADGKPDFCPLVEIPPHGRLIDADALIKDGWTLRKEVIRMGGYVTHELPLNNPSIPTIIEAEEGE